MAKSVRPRSNYLKPAIKVPKWIVGEDVPSSGIGQDGDLYLQSNGDVYVRDDGRWVFKMAITYLTHRGVAKNFD